MLTLETIVGFTAAAFTAVSYVPQLLKAFRTGSTGDLSFKMLATLGIGIALWILYGVLKGDLVIMISNGVSLSMILVLGVFKVRETRSGAADEAAPS